MPILLYQGDNVTNRNIWAAPSEDTLGRIDAMLPCADCGHPYFRPLSCKVFHLCPQLRTEKNNPLYGVGVYYQTFGEFAHFHSHWHVLVLDGEFDSKNRLVPLPQGPSGKPNDRESDSVTWTASPVAFSFGPIHAGKNIHTS